MIMKLKNKIMAIIILIIIIAGCVENANANNDDKKIHEFTYVNRYVGIMHDDERNVTCWVYAHGYGEGISCLPDKQFME